jgi:hypothetical protein
MPPERSHGPPTPAVRAVVYTTFLVLALVALWVPLYNRAEPAVLGIPFFYWFQFAWIVVTAVVTAIAYRLHV